MAINQQPRLLCEFSYENVKRFAQEKINEILYAGFKGRFFLAGGCYKSLIHGISPNDLDLWPASKLDRENLISCLESRGAKMIKQSIFNTLFTLDSLAIEVTVACPNSLYESVADFDIILSCVSVEFLNGKVINVYIHKDIDLCIKLCEVRLVSRLRSMKYVLLSLQRLKKYSAELGFSIQPGSFERIWNIYVESANPSELLDAVGFSATQVPEWARIKRVFIDGQPSEACRPFFDEELAAMKNSLFVCNPHHKSIVYILGLPGSGKKLLLDEILQILHLPSRKNFANVDIDSIRSFHGEFQRKLQGEKNASSHTTYIYKDLLSWFNEGQHVEDCLFKSNNFLVEKLLQEGRSIIMSIHGVAMIEFMEHVSHDYNYQSFVIEVKVPLEVAKDRVCASARRTGKFVSHEYLNEENAKFSGLRKDIHDFVGKQNKAGLKSKYIVFDNSRNGGGGMPLKNIY